MYFVTKKIPEKKKIPETTELKKVGGTSIYITGHKMAIVERG